MTKKRETQAFIALELLKERYPKYVPVWWFVGEKYWQGGKKYVLLSHKVPARLTELYQQGKVNRRMVKGRSGAYYYEYQYRHPDRAF